MKKIAILSAVNIRHMSLISLYTDILRERGIEYDIIYMDKYGEDEDFECRKKYRYVNVVKQNWPRPYKALKYMMFRPWAEKIMKRENYDFIIVWNDVAIFMFGSFLARHFKGKYCLNVRDNMKYDKKIYQKMFERSFSNSAFNTISSKGYLDFLPQNASYLPIHSLNLSVLKGMKIHERMRMEGESIRIGFIGYVRFYERNKKLLDAFANDKRFELHYYGTNADVLRQYADEKEIHNTVFHDTFPVEDTAKYLENIDVMNNLYGNETVNLRKAISIKLFHALYARIPILVCPDTYIGTIAKEIGIGFEISDEKIDHTLPDRLYDWYRSLNYDKLNSSCEEYLEETEKENAKFHEKAIEIIC